MTELLTTLAALILNAQLHTTPPVGLPVGLVTSHVNGTVGLLAFDKNEFKGTTIRGKHAAVAVSGLGDIVGVVLNKRGTALCEFEGYYDGECVVLVGCGTDGAAC
jgi:hypothetical protein